MDRETDLNQESVIYKEEELKETGRTCMYALGSRKKKALIKMLNAVVNLKSGSHKGLYI